MGSDECSLSSCFSLTLPQLLCFSALGAPRDLAQFLLRFICVHDATALCTRLYGKMDFIRELEIELKIKLLQNWFSHFGVFSSVVILIYKKKKKLF